MARQIISCKLLNIILSLTHRLYGIIVIETRLFNFNSRPPDPSGFNDAAPYDSSGQYYITAAWNDATQIPSSYTVGNESSTTVDGVAYFNAKLKTGVEYAILYRVEIVSDNDMVGIASSLSVVVSRQQ